MADHQAEFFLLHIFNATNLRVSRRHDDTSESISPSRPSPTRQFPPKPSLQPGRTPTFTSRDPMFPPHLAVKPSSSALCIMQGHLNSSHLMSMEYPQSSIDPVLLQPGLMLKLTPHIPRSRYGSRSESFLCLSFEFQDYSFPA